MNIKIIICILLLLVPQLLISGNCLAANKTLLMATTTSADNTGLLDYLAPKFNQASGIILKWTATGTGKALKLGQNCDVSVLLVHSPPAEQAFIQAGYGIMRTTIMHNAFIIVGPQKDSAHIRGLSAVAGFNQIAKQHALFISRGDDSGTNKKELQLWHQVNITPPQKSSWYLQSGQGMMATLRIAAAKQAYTLTDQATYIKFATQYKHKPPLITLLQDNKALINKYSVIIVNPKHCKNTQFRYAKKFLWWMNSAKTKQYINAYKLLNKKLFITYDN